MDGSARSRVARAPFGPPPAGSCSMPVLCPAVLDPNGPAPVLTKALGVMPPIRMGRPPPHACLFGPACRRGRPLGHRAGPGPGAAHGARPWGGTWGPALGRHMGPGPGAAHGARPWGGTWGPALGRPLGHRAGPGPGAPARRGAGPAPRPCPAPTSNLLPLLFRPMPRADRRQIIQTSYARAWRGGAPSEPGAPADLAAAADGGGSRRRP